MRKFFFNLIILFGTLNGTAQELIFEKAINLNYSNKNSIKKSIPIVNSYTNKIALFLIGKLEVFCILFNKNFEQLDSYNTSLLDNKFPILLGNSITQNKYHLFFTNDKKKKFYIKTIDINNKKENDKILEFKLKDEIFLESFSYENKFYLLTVKFLSSIIKIREFEGNSITQTLELGFKDQPISQFSDNDIFDVLSQTSSGFRGDFGVQKIDNSTPNSLNLTSKLHKIYLANDKLYITLDKIVEHTELISIDLKTFNFNIQLFPKEDIHCNNPLKTKSNSYLYKNILYQIKGCKHEISFSGRYLENESLIKSVRLNKDEEFTFKNTPYMENGSSMFKKNIDDEIENTKKLIKKIYSSKIGISAFEKNNITALTIGGFKYTATGSSGSMTMMSSGHNVSTSQGTISVAPTYHYNPSMSGYSNYLNSKSTYFKALIDIANFQHISGDIPQNIFDEIQEFEISNDNKFEAKTLFKIEDYYIYGYYDNDEEKYFLRKFVN